MLSNLRFALYTFSCRAVDTLHLPPYKGSTLRGGFGATFRRVVCITRLPECRPCILRAQCSYSYLFETPALSNGHGAVAVGLSNTQPPTPTVGPKPGPQAPRTFDPHPFVIEPPAETKEIYRPGEAFRFNLVLIGKAIDYFPYFVLTFEELGRQGVGRGRGRYQLESVSDGRPEGDQASHISDQLIYDGITRRLGNYDDKRPLQNGRAAEIAGLSPTCPPERSRLTVRFLTPTRIQYQNRLTSDVTFEILLRALLRRLSLLSEVHCGEVLDLDYRKLIGNAREQVRTESAHLRWHDWERYSARQDTRLKMGGFVGEITFAGRLAEFLPFLVLGQYLHVGKGTAFGLGKYEIVTGPPAP